MVFQRLPRRPRCVVLISLAVFFAARWAGAQSGPTDSVSALHAAREAAARKQWDKAIEGYRQVLALALRNEDAELGLADAYRQVFNYAEARRVLEDSRRHHPQSVAPLIAHGELEMELQHYESAIADLARALGIEPSNLKARLDLAAAYRSKGDSTKALFHLDRAIARAPQNALAYYLRASIFDDRNDDTRALPDAEKVFRLQPENIRGRLLLAKILLRKQDCARVVDLLKPLAGAPQEESQTLYLLGRAYQCSGQPDLAQETLARFAQASQQDRLAAENHTQALHLVEQAGELARQNTPDPALDLLEQALAKDPANGGAYTLLAKILYSAGEVGKAHDAIRRALEIRPFHPDSLYVLGRILEKEGKPEEALQAFAQIVAVNPSEADAYYEMGAIYQKQGDRIRALAALKKAVELAPDDPDYKQALAAAASASDSP
jgi:tetratricopeptide (TPR) repeat protein